MSSYSHETGAPPKPRRLLSLLLIAFGSLTLALSVLTLWLDRQALDTEGWVDTSSRLLEAEEIRSAVADFLVEQLLASVNTDDLARALPEGVSVDSARAVAESRAEQALAREEVIALWREANRLAHSELVAIVDDKRRRAAEDGTLTLDLGAILDLFVAELGLGQSLADEIEATANQVEIVQVDDVERVSDGLRGLRALAWAAPALTLALFALAIVLARGWRARAVQVSATAVAVIGGLILLGHALLTDAIAEAASDRASANAAVDATLEIGTSQLTGMSTALVVAGALIFIGAGVAAARSRTA